MKVEDIRKLISRKPFKPIRLTLVSGDSIPIQHPECIAIGEELIGVVYRENGSETWDVFGTKDVVVVKYRAHSSRK